MRTMTCICRDLHRACRAFIVFRGGLSEFVDCADHQKNCARDNEKINHQRDEVAVIPGDRSGFRCVSGSIECRRAIFGRSQNDKLIREIESTREKTDRRHDHVFDQRTDDRTEGRSDDYANSKIDRIAFDGEFLELLPDLPHMTMLTSFFGTTTTLPTVLPVMNF